MNRDIVNTNRASKIAVFIFIAIAVFGGFAIMTKRWSKIRDIRRQADAQAIVKALDYYYSDFGYYPVVKDDDGDGWDMSNDTNQQAINFLEPLVKNKYLASIPFDPTNDDIYYYRYKKFTAGEYGCDKPFYVFQIARFETSDLSFGSGTCPNLDWTKIAPQGYTAMELE